MKKMRIQGVKRRIVLVVIVFEFLRKKVFALFDLVHEVDASITANSMWKYFLKYE